MVEQVEHRVPYLAAQVFQEDLDRAVQVLHRLDLLHRAAQAALQVMEMLVAQDHLVQVKTLSVDQVDREQQVVQVFKMFQAVMVDRVLILGQLGQVQLQQV
jgi:hypothetical protein